VICHGQGNPSTDGCCYVNGAPCPLRWKIVAGRILEGPTLIDRGTVDSYINSIVSGKPNRDRAKALVQGAVYICSAAVDVLVASPALLNDRPGFEAAWNAHARYVAEVRPAWVDVEQRLGLPAGSYQCSTWMGVQGPECCFAEDQATNDTKAAALTATAVSIRQRTV
jgi:hypothetical protein